MSAGTLTLTNNSDLVSGAGTSFSTELTAGDFVVATVGGVTYTLPVKSVEGDTEITLISKYPGPTQQDSAWNAVPRATQNQVTAALVVQSTEALRGLNYDKQNWQAVFSAAGNITVFLPDGTSFSGPSWRSIAETLSTLDVDYLNQLAVQINQDAQQVEADKKTVVNTAEQVSTDAQTASTAATGAQGSAIDAAQSETNAEDYKELARKYALNPEDSPVTGNEYSSFHYSEKSRKSAEEAASHNPAEALVKSLNLSDLADRAAAWLNLRPLGSTPLAGDAVNPYDAPTLRQVENMVGAGGGLGPTLNGVQNFGVGQPALWTSRAFIPAWSVVADGQILNRADWPELWAHAQMHTPISDADWLANPGKRGNYSNGDGSTTFRVPDINGVQSGSIPGLFGRGDQGGLLPSGNVYESAAPEIAGTLNFRQVRAPAGELANNLVGSGGSFNVNTGATGQYGPISLNSTLATSLQLISFKASDSSLVYGRSANQVWPNSFVGVWIIRASGGFTAANTSWTVYNGDDAAPPTNTTALGGAVRSEYQIGGSLAAAASFTARYTELDGGVIRGEAQLAAAGPNNSSIWWFNADGTIRSSSGAWRFKGTAALEAGEYLSFALEDKDSSDADGVGKWWAWSLDGNYGSYFIKRRRNGVNTGQIVISMPSAAGTIALQGTSGLAYKHSVKDADLAEAVSRIDALRMVNFVYNDDEQNRVRFGVIAEEAEQVAPQYIKHNSEPTADILDKDGNKIGEETRDRPSVDNNPIVMDLLGYVKHLKAEIEMLKTALKGQ
ncbi:tail fiber domain-containing protein [Citrobacter amalonaticus]|uniref:tail fiber domain-containing protein n=1 Tax=Citrobacter amalonaticus TaxID=35703 RepID=UPI00388DED2D